MVRSIWDGVVGVDCLVYEEESENLSPEQRCSARWLGAEHIHDRAVREIFVTVISNVLSIKTIEDVND